MQDIFSKEPTNKADGIYSFVKSSNDFDDHWNKNNIPEIPKVKLNIANNYLAPFYHYAKENKITKVLDAGCGDGVHIEVINQNKIVEPSSIVALDISRKALEITRNRVHKANFVQGSVSDLPFQNESFDSVFSYGVIAYSDKPQESFRELVRCLKKGGLLGLWIFPKKVGLGGFIFNTIRNTCNLFGKRFTNLLANTIVPFLYVLPTNSKINLSNSTWKQCREIVLVNIAPSQLFFPTKQEVFNWFKENNLEIKSIDKSNPLTIWAIKN